MNGINNMKKQAIPGTIQTLLNGQIKKPNFPKMKHKLPTKIEVKSIEGKGMGVFATELIIEGEIIEECHLLTLPIKVNEPSALLKDYRFLWPAGGNFKEQVIPLGYGCIYNHSDENNAYWRDHPRYKAFQFVTLRDIQPGEEICTYYGNEDYWKDRPYVNKI